jgi:hypothetical protein
LLSMRLVNTALDYAAMLFIEVEQIPHLLFAPLLLYGAGGVITTSSGAQQGLGLLPRLLDRQRPKAARADYPSS